MECRLGREAEARGAVEIGAWPGWVSVVSESRPLLENLVELGSDIAMWSDTSDPFALAVEERDSTQYRISWYSRGRS